MSKSIRESVESNLDSLTEQLKIYRDRVRESPDNDVTRSHYERRMRETLTLFELLNYCLLGNDDEIIPRAKQLIASGWERRAEIGIVLRGIVARHS